MPNLKPNDIQLVTHLMIPKSQHLDALFSEILVSLFIARTLIRKPMSTAIHFNRQFCDGTVEIEEVRTARVLAAELEFAETSVPQQAPETFLRFG